MASPTLTSVSERAVEQQSRHRLVTTSADVADQALADYAKPVQVHLFPQPRMPHADRTAWSPDRFQSHARCRLICLDADVVEDVDRRAVARVAHAVAAVVRPHQPHAGLVIGG